MYLHKTPWGIPPYILPPLRALHAVRGSWWSKEGRPYLMYETATEIPHLTSLRKGPCICEYHFRAHQIQKYQHARLKKFCHILKQMLQNLEEFYQNSHLSHGLFYLSQAVGQWDMLSPAFAVMALGDRLPYPVYKVILTILGPHLPTWISNYIHHKVWNEITYPFPNFNGCIVEVWEWISNFIPHLTGHVVTYPWSD